MKKILIYILIILSFYQCSIVKKNKADNNSSNESLVDFQILKPHHYWSQVPYPYKLTYPDSMDIKLIGNNVIISEEYHYFNIMGNLYYPKGEIYIIDNKTTDTIQTIQLHGTMPPITLLFNGTTGGRISADKFTEYSAIVAIIENFDISIYYDIVSFTMLIQSGDSILELPRTYALDCDNWKIRDVPRKECQFFSEEQLNAIHSIKGSQIVVFKDIVIQTDSNHQKTLEPAYWIVEEKKK